MVVAEIVANPVILADAVTVAVNVAIEVDVARDVTDAIGDGVAKPVGVDVDDVDDDNVNPELVVTDKLAELEEVADTEGLEEDDLKEE